MLTATLQQLRQLPLNFNPPATQAEIAEAERNLGVVLPDELKQLYSELNGFEENHEAGTRFYLMPLSEALEEKQYLQANWYSEEGQEGGDELVQNLLPIARSECDYMAIYLSGPMTGRLGYIWHETSFIQPLFRNLPNFLADIVREATMGTNLFDYPATQARPEWDAEDYNLFRFCLKQYQKTTLPLHREYYSHSAAYLCPFPQREELRLLLDVTGFDEYQMDDLKQFVEKRLTG
jgi:SMI1 / KNR4 family (SUKH-1)